MATPNDQLYQHLESHVAFADLLLPPEADPVLRRLLIEFEGVVQLIISQDPIIQSLEAQQHAAASLCRLSREIRLRLVELGGRASIAVFQYALEVLERVSEVKDLLQDNANIFRSLSNATMRCNWLRDRISSLENSRA